MKQATENDPAIRVNGLHFQYGEKTVFENLSVDIPEFSRCILLGGNGVGKSTLLRLVAGKHLVRPGSIEVLGADPFSGNLGRSDLSLVADKFPFDLDIPVHDIIDRGRGRRQGVNGHTLAELIELLEIDLNWRMHQVSNGQRRRVDLLLSLLDRPKLLLLDEVTSDLDILSRQNLLDWLKVQTEARKMTVVFATHILDGMHAWATHLAFLSPLRLRYMGPLGEAPGMADARRHFAESPLLWLSRQWLLEDRSVKK